MNMRIRTIAVALLLIAAGRGSASAQDNTGALPPPPLDVAIMYSYMTEEWLDRQLPAGWVVSAQGHLSDRLAIVGEANGAYWGQNAFPQFFPYAAWVHSILGGPRVKVATGRKTTLFGQVLGGYVRRTRTNPGSIIAPENEGNVDTLGLQPGGGVDFRINRRYSVRVQSDYRWLKSTSVTARSTGEARIAAGIVIGVERRP